MTQNTETDDERRAVIGLVFGLSAFFIWGLLPIYLKQINGVSAWDILAWRIVFSTIVVAAGLALIGKLGTALAQLRALIATPRALITGPGLTALLISVSWLIFLWAVTSGRILETSVGYYINPLVIVLLGRIVLKESLSRLQWAAILLAASGLMVMLIGVGTWPWVPVTLAFSFGIYALLRKTSPMDGLVALLIESLLLTPFAALWLLAAPWSAGLAGPLHAGGIANYAWLFGAGLMTVVPLGLYIAASRRLRFSTTGMLQYLAPTLSFLSGVFLYGEPFTLLHGVMFSCIWVAVIIFMTDLQITRRRNKRLRDLPRVAVTADPVDAMTHQSRSGR